MNTNEIAYQIYLAHYGHLDDKYFQASKMQEIIDWLLEGEPDGNLAADITEWGEYDADEIKRNRPKNAAAAALGSIKSERKAAAARENGRKGGRPRKG